MKIKLSLVRMNYVEDANKRKFPTPEVISESPILDLKDGQSLNLQNWLFKINGITHDFQIVIDTVSGKKKEKQA